MQPALAEAQLLAMHPMSALPEAIEAGAKLPAHDVWADERSVAKPASEVARFVRKAE
jgi:hypothetical protein